jgi:hypothetical protein
MGMRQASCSSFAVVLVLTPPTTDFSCAHTSVDKCVYQSRTPVISALLQACISALAGALAVQCAFKRARFSMHFSDTTCYLPSFARVTFSPDRFS